MKAQLIAAFLKRWIMSEFQICARWYDWCNRYGLQWRFPSQMILTACIVSAFLLVGCSNQRERRTGLAEAERIVSQIHTNMKFREISKIIPLGTNDPAVVRTHGGDWYQVELQDGYYLQLRFNRPVEGSGVLESLLNSPPRLRKHEGVGQ